MSPTSPPLGPGARVGSFELVRLLGEGSMGRVFEARHLKLDRKVGLKVLREEHAREPGLVQRFFQEARTVNRMDHPHIVSVHDFVEDVDEEGRPRAYCVMELLEGQTLAALVKQGPLALDRALRMADQVCGALAAAHAVGVIHRDLKPENVLVMRAGDGRDFVKVLDFGVAKLVRPDPKVKLDRTWEGALVGTPRYMAPEQAASLPVDFRADVYGLGCLLYEMIAGRPPFTGDSFATLMVQILTRPPDPLGSVSASGEAIPAALRDLVSACLAREPARRPPTAQALRERLRAARDRSRRRRWSALAVGACSAGVVLALAFVGITSPPAQAKRSPLASATPGASSAADPAQPRPVLSRVASPADPAATAAPPVGAPGAEGPVETAAAEPKVPRSRKVSGGAQRAVRLSSSGSGDSRDAVLDPFAR